MIIKLTFLTSLLDQIIASLEFFSIISIMNHAKITTDKTIVYLLVIVRTTFGADYIYP